MKKILIFTLVAVTAITGVAFAGPVMADVMHHASAIGFGSGLSLLGMALNIATPVTATSTAFVTPSSPHDMQIAIGAAINGTGTQDNALLVGATGAGVVIKYQTAIIPFAVPGTTCAQNTSSVTTNIQPGWQFATNSVYAANKPTMQAGLGIAGLTCATTGIINVNYMNLSSGAAATPTAEANDVLEFRTGPLTTTQALSPAAVPANTTTEQIFTLVPGAGQPTICLPGTIALVNKPTNQAALGYSIFARVVGINQVGVTFGYVANSSTAASTTILPTAAESYSFAFLPQLNAYSPTLIYGIPSGATAIGNSTTLEQTSGVTGVYLSDMVTGISRASSAAAGQFVAGARVSTGLPGSVTSSVYINYGAVVTSATPTTSEVVLANIMRQAPLNPLMIYNQAVSATTCPATTTVEATTTVTGLVVSSSVLVNKPTLTPGIMVVGARVSAANTLAITYANLTTNSVAVPAEVYTIGNVQLQGPGLGLTTTAGLFVAQSYYPSLQQSVTLANALRTALAAIDAQSTIGASVSTN